MSENTEFAVGYTTSQIGQHRSAFAMNDMAALRYDSGQKPMNAAKRVDDEQLTGMGGVLARAKRPSSDITRAASAIDLARMCERGRAHMRASACVRGRALFLESPKPHTVSWASASMVRPGIGHLTFTRAIIRFKAMPTLNELRTPSPETISSAATTTGSPRNDESHRF